eukprot:4529380-Pleurochrysis_carterae.AAC.1
MLKGPRKGKLTTTTQMVFRETVFPLHAEYQPSQEDDADGPIIDELVVMDDTDDDYNVAAAPGVAAGNHGYQLRLRQHRPCCRHGRHNCVLCRPP